MDRHSEASGDFRALGDRYGRLGTDGTKRSAGNDHDRVIDGLLARARFQAGSDNHFDSRVLGIGAGAQGQGDQEQGEESHPIKVSSGSAVRSSTNMSGL